MKKISHLFIGLALAGGALYYTLRNVSQKELVESFKSVDYVYVLPAVVLVALSYIMRAYRWRVLMLPIKKVGASSLLSPLMVGYLGNILPARAGELIRAWLLGKKHNVSFSGAFASIVVERLFDIVSILLLFTWFFTFRAEMFNSGATISGVSLETLAVKFGQVSAGLVIFLIAFIYLMVAHKDRLIRLVRRLLNPFPKAWNNKVLFLLEEFSLGFQVTRDFTALIKITLYSVLIWSTIILSYYPFFWAYDLNNKSLESALLVTVMICILITVLPTPAFLGSFNAAVLIALHDILNESEIKAASFGMVAWVVNFGFIFLAGLYFILHDNLSVRQLVKVEETEEELLHESEEKMNTP
ncbi:MAG: lysylphosphatidylglycerol synthase transmembrane domain-containing protein [Nitrospinaceae bacterium]